MNRHVSLILATVLFASCASATDEPWQETALTDITPEGWLKEQFVMQKEGLTGHPEALSYPYNTCLWAGEIPRQGNHGQDWWRYEQTAYYTDGLLRMGYLTGDKELIEKGEEGIRYTFEHPWDNGRLGSKRVENTWPFAVFFRAVKAAYDVHPDPAILEALTRHYNSIPTSQLVRKRDIISVEGMLWTAEKTGNQALVARADSVFRLRTDLLAQLEGVKLKRDDRVTPEFLTGEEPYKMHGVTMSEMLKLPIMLYAATGDSWYKELAVSSLDRLYEEDGLPDGLFTSAEWLQGRDIRHSHETCNAVDMSWTLGYFLEILKEPRYADMLEKIVFNAGAGSVTNDFKALQYYSSVNQFLCTGTSNHNKDNFCSTWMAYRPTHQTECCAGNIHRLYPNYAARLWLRSHDGMVAALYGPSRFQYSDDLAIREETAYPYDDVVRFTVEATKGRHMARLTLRIPGWCRGATLSVNGKAIKKSLESGSFVTLDGPWKNSDEILLRLPMEPVRQMAYGGGVWFERGPLVYTYAIPAIYKKDTERYPNMNGKYPADDEAFPCWDIQPSAPWNYGVAADVRPEYADGKILISACPVEWEWAKGPKGELLTPDLPESPRAIGPAQTLELVPYGGTTLRLTVFPALAKDDDVLPVIGAQVFIEPGQRPKQVDAWFATLEESGMNACRIRMFESYMRTPDGWDFSLFDTAFESAKKHGIGIWCTLFPATEKTDIGGWKFPRDAAQQQSFAEFIEALVTHYRSHPALRGWVLINEPGVHDIPDTPFVNAARERWDAAHPAKEFKENGYPVLMDLREERFLSDLNRDFLAWIAAEVARYDTNHDIHVNPHAVFDLYAQHDFPAYRNFLTSLGGSAHPAWHFGFFPREDYALAMMAESEILRSGAGNLPWFMTEIQGGNNTYSGLNALCPTPDEIRQWLWSVIACEGRGGIFWMLNPRSSGIEAGEWAMIDFQGQPTGRLQAAAEVASVLKQHRELFAGLREIPSGIDVVYLRESVWAEKLMARKDDPIEARRPGGVTKSSLSCWRALTARGLNVGIKAFGEYDFSQDDYAGKTIILSHQICLPDACIAPLTHFVECGGTLIVEGLTGFFDEDLHCTMNTGFRYASIFGGEISEFILTPDHLWECHFADSDAPVKITSQGRGKVVWMPSSYALDAWSRRNWKPLSEMLIGYAAMNPAAVSFRRGYCRDLLLRSLESPQGRVVVCIDLSGKNRCPRLQGFSVRNAAVLYEGGGVRVLFKQS